ncbi:cleavage stimulation factor subunit 1-like isoform X2 [Zophobas morio]|uniref:cleavage stimulation factor subunit 1-like isoform X2 n=1 Tax=Zophobas morio TaxID=2755281 RepID=UPI003083A2B0
MTKSWISRWKLVKSYKPIFFTSHKGPCYTAVFSHDGKYAATGSADTSVKLLDVEMMVAKRETKETANPCRHTLKEHKQPVTTVAFDFSDTKLVTGSQDGTIKFFDLSKLGRARQRSVCTISDSHVIHSIDYHPSSQYLLVGTSNPVVRLYDVATQTCFASANELEYHSASVNHVAFSCDGKVYASASSDGSIKLWDGVSSRCVATFSEAHGQSSVDCVRISRNFKYLLSCGRDNIIRLWDLAMGQVLIAYEGGSHAKYGLKASFSHNERFVLGANDGSNTAVAWDTRTGEMEQGLVQPSIPGHAAPIREIATSPNVSGFLTATEDKTARYWHYS